METQRANRDLIFQELPPFWTSLENYGDEIVDDFCADRIPPEFFDDEAY
jgi:hypothetical protein